MGGGRDRKRAERVKGREITDQKEMVSVELQTSESEIKALR